MSAITNLVRAMRELEAATIAVVNERHVEGGRVPLESAPLIAAAAAYAPHVVAFDLWYAEKSLAPEHRVRPEPSLSAREIARTALELAAVALFAPDHPTSVTDCAKLVRMEARARAGDAGWNFANGLFTRRLDDRDFDLHVGCAQGCDPWRWSRSTDHEWSPPFASAEECARAAEDACGVARMPVPAVPT